MGHTPGPWIFGAEVGADSTRIETESGKIIGAIRTREITKWDKSNPVYEWSDEGHANARLVSAAPDFLKAAILFKQHVIDFDNGDDVSAMLHYAEFKSLLDAAIAKATGA